MKLKPVPEKIKKYVAIRDIPTRNEHHLMEEIATNREKIDDIISYLDYLRERVQELEDKRHD